MIVYFFDTVKLATKYKPDGAAFLAVRNLVQFSVSFGEVLLEGSRPPELRARHKVFHFEYGMDLEISLCLFLSCEVGELP